MGPIKNTIPREKLRRLAGEMLRLAADKFSNHGCNDFDRPNYFTKAEWEQMAVEYELWNSGGQDEASPLGDWTIMAWLSKLAEAGEL